MRNSKPTASAGASPASARGSSLETMALLTVAVISFMSASSPAAVFVHGWSTSTTSAAGTGRSVTTAPARRSTTSLASFPLRHELSNSCAKPSSSGSSSSVRKVFNKLKNCRGGHQQKTTTTSLQQTSTSSSTDNDKSSSSSNSLVSLLKKFDQRQLKAMTAGLAVSLAMIPEAVAFAFVAGVNPLVGLWTTVILGFTAATLGGRPGICSSASGAVSVVIASLCQSHGTQYLSACAILAGIIQITCGGFLKMGKLINLVPHPVMLGFVNGLAIVMTKAQMMHFQNAAGAFMSLTSPVGSATYGIAALTMVLVKVIPKITKIVPPSLGAVAIASIFAKLMKLPAKTLSDVAGASTFVGGWSVLPKLGLPQVPLTLDMLQTIFPYAATMAAVGCLESLLTMQLIDGMMADEEHEKGDGKQHTPSSAKQECIGQGTGNILSGLTGGIGGCALLGQSIINVQSGGGVSRLSGMSMAAFLGLGIVAAAPLLANVPVASLVGVMLLVCYSTFSWSSLRLFNKIPKLDAAVIALVSIVTVQKDLAVAVLAGTVTSALGFAYKQSTAFKSTYEWVDKQQTKKKYNLRGPLFFGSTKLLDTKIFTPSTIANDPNEVVLDFTEARIMDHSAVDAIHTLSDKYTELGKTVTLQGLCVDSTKILTKYCRGRQSPPFQMVNTEKDDASATNGQKDTTVYKALPV